MTPLTLPQDELKRYCQIGPLDLGFSFQESRDCFASLWSIAPRHTSDGQTEVIHMHPTLVSLSHKHFVYHSHFLLVAFINLSFFC